MTNKNKKYRGSNTSRDIITVLVTILLSAGALLAFPYFLFAASENLFTGAGICDSREKDEDLWAKGYCFAFDAAKHQVLGDTAINELRRYSISVAENVDEAKKAFLDRRQAAIGETVSIGGSGWKKIDPEDVSIGDAGFMEIAKLPRGGYVGSTSLIPDTDNAEEGYFDEYIFRPIFLQGRCFVEGVFLGTITYNEAYKMNHREEAYRDSSDHVRYRLINSHPASDHSLREETKTVIVNDLQKLVSRLAPACGGVSATQAPLVANVPEVEAITDTRPIEKDFVFHGGDDIKTGSIPMFDAIEITKEIRILIVGVRGNPAIRFPDGTVKELTENDARLDVGEVGSSPAFDHTRPPEDEIGPIQAIGRPRPLEDWVKYRDQAATESAISIPVGSRLAVEDREDIKFYIYRNNESSPQGGISIVSPTLLEFNQPQQETGKITKFTFVELNLENGEIRVKDENSSINTQVGDTTVKTKGTDYGVAYDPVRHRTVIEIYDGEVEIKLTNGEVKTIASKYDSPIRRLEISDGTAVEQIAIPKDEWQARQTPQAKPPDQQKNGSLIWILIIAALGGGTFILHKTGKLKPILQKVLASGRRDNSKSP